MVRLQTLFITGMTGSAGSWIARQALEAGVHITALVREDATNHVADRARRALAVAGYKGPFDKLQVMAGDITRPGSLQDLPKTCRSVDAVVHCAASMKFADAHADHNYSVNVEGTHRMLELAEALHVPFVHLSTAYIAGQQNGIVREEPLPEPGKFNNSYEATKHQAEQAVLEWTHRTGLQAWIFRPSIILGDSHTGRIVNFDAMYHILRFLDMISGRMDGQTLRIETDPNVTKNCIPVDYLAHSVWQLVHNAQPGIYHITHPVPLRLGELERIFKTLFDIEKTSFVAPGRLKGSRLTRPEILFRRSASVYFPYLRQEPVFDRSKIDAALQNTVSCPALDVHYFDRIIQYARQSEWGQNRHQQTRGKKEQTRVRSYYGTFLREKIGHQLLPDLKRLNAQFKIIVTDVENADRTLTIRHGILERICDNGQSYECSFTVNYDTFRRITEGTLAPQEAFFRKDIDIQGDIETGLKLATVLAVFFKKYPYSPNADPA